jgi:VCBS repeat-containing protein
MVQRIEQEYGYYTIDDNGKFHSDNDEPAITVNSHDVIEIVGDTTTVTNVEGYRAWYRHGLLHRDNNDPAIVRDGGTEYFFINGEKV